MFSIFIQKRENKPTTESETVQRRASRISPDTPKTWTPVCAAFARASGDTAEQLGGVMCRFRYKGGEKMGTKRSVGLAADVVIFIRTLQ